MIVKVYSTSFQLTPADVPAIGPWERSYYPAAARGPVENTLHSPAQTG